MKEAHTAFWDAYPALGWGISATLGAIGFFEHSIFIAVLWIVYQLYLSISKGAIQAILLISVFLYSASLFSHLPLPKEGRAVFSIHSVEKHASPFQSGWLYKGTLHAFRSEKGAWATSLPCSVLYRGEADKRPKANVDYFLTGQLQNRREFDFSFKAKEWEARPHSWSLAEFRYLAKERIHTILKHHLHEWHSAPFLNALFTGNIEDRMLRFEFGRLGLQYLLVISGFHFAILSAFIAFALRFMMPSRWRLWFLLIAVSIYFLFVGNSPPVQRSYLAASIFLIGSLLGRRSSGLNILGACLLIEILLNPIIVRTIGFQLSFLSCFGIFLFYRPIQRLLHPILPIRRLEDAAELSLPSKCGFVLSSFFTRALCLTLSVNLALWPLLLFHFHRFPFLSLFYNLFVPPLTALCLFLLLAALTAYAFFPLFSLPLFKILDLLSGELLEVIGHPPAILDRGISTPFPGWILAPYVTILFIGVIYLRQRESCGLTYFNSLQ